MSHNTTAVRIGHIYSGTLSEDWGNKKKPKGYNESNYIYSYGSTDVGYS
jgi:hypothetical protein